MNWLKEKYKLLQNPSSFEINTESLRQFSYDALLNLTRYTEAYKQNGGQELVDAKYEVLKDGTDSEVPVAQYGTGTIFRAMREDSGSTQYYYFSQISIKAGDKSYVLLLSTTHYSSTPDPQIGLEQLASDDILYSGVLLDASTQSVPISSFPRSLDSTAQIFSYSSGQGVRGLEMQDPRTNHHVARWLNSRRYKTVEVLKSGATETKKSTSNTKEVVSSEGFSSSPLPTPQGV